MSFSILDKHKAIGWDVDGTLFQHPKSSAMHTYILAHPEKKHVIVTHRSHGWEKVIFRELAAHYKHAPTAADFDAVINVEDEVYENFAISQRSPGGLILPDYSRYIEWKGMMCKQHGLTVLVDDNFPHTKQGCDLHGILLIHPDDL